MKYAITLFFMVMFFSSCNNDNQPDQPTPQPSSSTPVMSFSVSNSFRHDTASFTEGFGFYNGLMLESTGNYGRSKMMTYDLKSGNVKKTLTLDPKFFGEGVAVLRDTIYQLTYREKTVFVYTKDFKKIKELRINTEGWGLTTDGNVLIASDGTSNLYYYEPGTFRLLRTQGVTENGDPVSNVNELEYVNGFIYANQWQTNTIFKIDANSGQIVAKMDLSELQSRASAKYNHSEVLNGIAYDSSSKKLYVTGKWWPEIYELSGNW